jgi:hypothetical protein
MESSVATHMADAKYRAAVGRLDRNEEVMSCALVILVFALVFALMALWDRVAQVIGRDLP